MISINIHNILRGMSLITFKSIWVVNISRFYFSYDASKGFLYVLEEFDKLSLSSSPYQRFL